MKWAKKMSWESTSENFDWLIQAVAWKSGGWKYFKQVNQNKLTFFESDNFYMAIFISMGLINGGFSNLFLASSLLMYNI